MCGEGGLNMYDDQEGGGGGGAPIQEIPHS